MIYLVLSAAVLGVRMTESLCLRSRFGTPITAARGLEHETTPVIQPNMNEISDYVASVAKFFKLQLGASLTDVYKLGSLAHGGYSQT